jgi:AraC family transcriptional regulator
MKPGLGVWVLEAPEGFGDAAFHSHHAIQLTVCLAGTLRLIGATTSVSGPCVAVAADARHRFEASGLLAFLFVEPESRRGRALTEFLFREGELAAIDSPEFRANVEPLRSAFVTDPGRPDLLASGDAAVAALAGGDLAPEPDPRIRRIIAQASARLDGPLTLAQAAEGVFLSESRLRHLFVEQTGLAFRTYFVWLRLFRAVSLYAEGSSLTEAAHEAGFADSAHFSRIFKRTFGLPATTLARV